MSYEQFYSNRDVVSLFSGAMGLDIGLQQAGLNVVIGQDFEPACVETMKANGHNVLGGDIREIQPQQLLDLTGLQRGEPFLICGGPPCQPFSTAGKRLGINDPRGSLFMDFIRMIDYIRPRFFIMENVKGIMSAPLKHVPGAERDESDPDQKLGTVLDVILSEFNKLGYKTVYGILDAVNYGVPQFRERFVLIGSRDHEDIFLPVPTHFQMHQNPEYLKTTTDDVFVIQSTDDQMVPYEMSLKIIEGIDNPHIKTKRYEGRKHNPNYTDAAVAYMNDVFGQYYALIKDKKIVTDEDKIAYFKDVSLAKLVEQDEQLFDEMVDFIEK